MVVCRLCGEEFVGVTYTHLKYVHGITTDEYRSMFPGVELLSKDTRRRLSEINKGNEHAVGFVMREETKRLLSAAQIGNENALGCTHIVSEETRGLMSESMKGNESALGHEVSEKARQQIARAVSVTMKELWKDPEYAKRMSVNWSRKPSRPELQLQRVLDKHFPGEWKYVGDRQFWIEGRNPDFVNVNSKKQIIEVFGYFWHNPDYFPNRPTKEELIAHYKSYGFDCLVFWEFDVWDEDGIVKRVREITLKGGTYK